MTEPLFDPTTVETDLERAHRIHREKIAERDRRREELKNAPPPEIKPKKKKRLRADKRAGTRMPRTSTRIYGGRGDRVHGLLGKYDSISRVLQFGGELWRSQNTGARSWGLAYRIPGGETVLSVVPSSLKVGEWRTVEFVDNDENVCYRMRRDKFEENAIFYVQPRTGLERLGVPIRLFDRYGPKDVLIQLGEDE